MFIETAKILGRKPNNTNDKNVNGYIIKKGWSLNGRYK